MWLSCNSSPGCGLICICMNFLVLLYEILAQLSGKSETKHAWPSRVIKEESRKPYIWEEGIWNSCCCSCVTMAPWYGYIDAIVIVIGLRVLHMLERSLCACTLTKHTLLRAKRMSSVYFWLLGKSLAMHTVPTKALSLEPSWRCSKKAKVMTNEGHLLKKNF